MGVYGRIGGIEEPHPPGGGSLDVERLQDAPLGGIDGPIGWDFETSSSTPPFRRHPPAPGVVYAELPIRAVAFLIDLTLVGVAARIAIPALQQVANTVLPEVRTDSLFFGATMRLVAEYLVLPILVILVASGFMAALFWTRFRATPGQMMLGLFTVTRGDGLPLSRSQAVLRWLLLFGPVAVLTGSTSLVLDQVDAASGLRELIGPNPVVAILTVAVLAWYGLLASTIALDRRGRGLHDRLAGSVVARREGSPS